MEKRTASPRTTPPTSPGGSAPTGSAPGTAATTTTIPRRPTGDDIELLGFVRSFELAAADLYQAALDGGLAESDHADLFQTLRENHEEYANRMSAILGVDSPRQRDDAAFDERRGDFESGDAASVAAAGVDLEATAVATHTELLSQLTGIEGVTALASIVVVEARQATVLGDLAGNGDDLDALLTSDAEPLEVSTGSASGWRTS